MFFRDINLIYNKNISRWRESFVIVDYVKKHKFNYKLLKLNDIKISNQFHKNYLRSFFVREEYLRSINEKILLVMKNLKKTKKKIMKKIEQKKTIKKSFD